MAGAHGPSKKVPDPGYNRLHRSFPIPYAPARARSSSPGLQIFVRREEPRKLCFEVRSDRLGFNNTDFGWLLLEGDTKIQLQEELRGRMDRLSDLATDESRQESAREQLADMAVALFQKLPEKLQELLWSQRGRSESVQILSDDLTSRGSC